MNPIADYNGVDESGREIADNQDIDLDRVSREITNFLLKSEAAMISIQNEIVGKIPHIRVAATVW